MDSRTEILDVLLDLKHDLGKYLLLPLAMLEDDAAPEDVVQAIRRALFETRVAGGHSSGAREIWARYRAELEPLLGADEGFAVLERAVEEALSMERELDEGGVIRRDEAARKLGGVSSAISSLLAVLKEEE